MPQMNPMNWIFLFLFNFMIFFSLITNLYFIQKKLNLFKKKINKNNYFIKNLW